MFSFEGDFKTRPKVSLGGASKKVGKPNPYPISDKFGGLTCRQQFGSNVRYERIVFNHFQTIVCNEGNGFLASF